MHKGWIREFYPIGAQSVRMKLPENRQVSKVELLCAGTSLPFRSSGGIISFIVPQVVDYEVAAIYAE
jgi:hypothetical protein